MPNPASSPYEADPPVVAASMCRCVHHFIEAVVARTPEACALIHEGEALTYEEMDTWANRLARHLQDLGVGPEVIVAVCLERSVAAILSILAVLKAGGAYLPLDPAYPAERLGYMLENSRAAFLITEAEIWHGHVAADQMISFREFEASVPAAPVARPAHAVAAVPGDDPLAYVIYTSGSTGQPKGVAMPHGPLVNLLRWQARTCPLTAGARVLQFAPLSFDVSFQEIFSTLGAGGTLMLIGEELRRDPRGLLRFLAEQEVTRVFLPPVMLHQLAEQPANGDGAPRRLREVITAGEALRITPAVAAFFASLGGHCALHNHYGPTETHVITGFTLTGEPEHWPVLPPIGKPIDNAHIVLLGENNLPVADGEAGSLFVGGDCLARGYLHAPELTDTRFVELDLGTGGPARFYRTGDLAQRLPDGNLQFLGRADDQVKIRGFRIELGEVENVLSRHPAIREAAVGATAAAAHQSQELVGYIVPREASFVPGAELRRWLLERIPDYMVPTHFALIERLPLTPSGKVDRRALQQHAATRVESGASVAAPPATRMEKIIAQLWEETLGLKTPGVRDNFFEVGGNSLLAVKIHTRLCQTLEREFPITALFQHPTIASLAGHLGADPAAGRQTKDEPSGGYAHRPSSTDRVAIVGMAGRFPGAGDVAAFWENLKAGVESITHFTADELELPPDAAGTDGSAQRFVNARGVLEGADQFDAAFFGIHARDAEQMDPQHRVFLECAWEALEQAGHDPEQSTGRIGVWAGASLNSYLLYNLCTDRAFITRLVGGYQQSGPADFLGNEKDFLATRVSYKLDLRGPSLTVQTACSTSLVAVVQACQALLDHQTDMALAGGVSISFPQRRAYPYQEGGMASADGHTRTFDAAAAGTVFSSGAGVVVLKRLADAQADGDHIFAVIKGAAVNNDGASKVSYTAPSIDGQAEVIQTAQTLAGVGPDSISYVEAHGTATPLGDPIELAGLTQAFRRGGATGNSFCAIGSLKTNVGHLETASGVAALIKTALALKHGVIPPSLNYTAPNPKLGLADSPFYVNTKLLPWPPGENAAPRRAGVSSFGVGGTNAHAVLEEAPPVPAAEPGPREHRLFVLSARTDAALDNATINLARHLRSHPDLDPSDVSWTLQSGRRAFPCRRVVAARDLADAADALERRDAKRVFSRSAARQNPPVTFLFPGQGAQSAGMGTVLYRTEPVFRREIDRCTDLLRPRLDNADLREVLQNAEQLNQTQFTQPALFVFGYALAQLWMSWGVRPTAMLGHSVGEYVAACLSGVFSLEDALALVAERARLVQAQPGGVMLAVRLPEADLAPLLAAHGAGLSIAAVNSPTLCVVSGAAEAVAAFEEILAARRAASRRLHTSHAFHSAMMDAVVAPFAALVETIALRPPQIPFISNLTGRWITENEATDSAYWARHLREAVRFADGVGTLLAGQPGGVLLEVGPGQTLAPMVRQHPAAGKESGVTVVTTLQEGRDEGEAALTALGRLWLDGVKVNWAGFHAAARRRVPLPTYPFERKRYWIEPPKPASKTSLSNQENYPMSTTEPAPVSAPPARKTAILEKLRSLLKELSGQDLSGADVNTSFLELGFDSLFLTQVAGAFRKEFGIKVTFRQLLEELSTLDTLAGHLDGQLPPEVMKPAAPPPTIAQPVPVPVTLPGPTLATMPAAVAPAMSVGTPESAGILERVVQEQLRLMAQQLEMLRGGTTLSPVPLAAPALPAPAATTLPPSAVSAPTNSEPKAFGPYKPIDKAPGGGLTNDQQAHLDALVARYTARTPQSKRRTQENRAHFADPRTVSGFKQQWKEAVYPIVVEESAGARLRDIDCNEYVDLTMGFGTNLLGHSPAFITAALQEQLRRGVEVGPQSPLAGQVAALLCELTGTERAAFTNTGSEAVLAAVRLARTVTGRTRIATCGGFHGINDEVLVRANVVDGQRRSVPVAPGIPEHIVRDVLVVDYGTAEGLELLRAHAHELAAVLVEPVQSRRPDLQPREFLRAVREITQQAGCALIFDELINGFRCALGGAQAYFGVRADLVTYGKIIGGGMPVGALCGKAEYMDALDGGMWQYGDGSFPEVGVTFFAGTYIRHPLTIAASWAILNHLKNEGDGLQRRLNERTAQAVGEINDFCQQSGVPMRLEHFSSLFIPRFADDIKYGGLIFLHLRDRGVHVWEGRPCFFSTAHTDADIAFVVRAFKESIAEMQSGGFLPGVPLVKAGTNGHNGHANGTNGHLKVHQPERSAAASRELSTSFVQDEKPAATSDAKALQFSLYFFGNYPAAYDPEKYRIILESARYADQHDFAAVWLPERHFHPLGGFSPNPSILAAALARDTTRIALRGGSVVLPLHHPVRVAEEWAMVDNLSKGRVGMSIASGWHPNDFIFAPDRFERRREICTEDIETIQKLWRGEALSMRAGAGADFEVKLHPMPVQPRLPVWFTCIHEDSFARAGELGVGVLGYLMNQTVDELAAKIARYRAALQKVGHDPSKGQVTILVHTFVGDDLAATRERARGPLKDYLRSYLDNSQKKLESQNGPVDVEAEDLDYLLEKSYQDYVGNKTLIGTPASCAAVADRLREIGVDEIGCFVDFGVDAGAVLNGLTALNALRERYAPAVTAMHPPVARTLPLTESQSGLWVLGQTDRDALRTYNESTTLDLRGPLDIGRLHRAMHRVLNRHEALRTTIQPDGEAQVIHAEVTVEMPMLDLSNLMPDEQAARLAECWRAFEQGEFNFARGPLVRAQIVRLAATHHLLGLTFHHLVGNGPSYWVFLEELVAIYEGGTDLETPMQFGDYLHWRTGENASQASEDETYWLKRFTGGVPTLELPTDRPRPALQSHRGGRQRLTLSKELTAALRKVAAARRGSLFMVLLTAFECLMHRLSGQDDVVVGTSFEGEARSLPGGERLFANTTNVLPLRSRAGAETSFSELLAVTKDEVFGANEHQNYFFGRLIKKLGLPHDPSRPAVFSAFLNYESGKFERQTGDGLHIELLTDDVPYRSPRDTAMFELYLNVAEKDGELFCECDHASDLFNGETVQRWLGHYRTLLESVVGNPESSIWTLPLMDTVQGDRVLLEWNNTAVGYSLDTATLHGLIETQVQRTPEAVALVFEGTQLTFGQLDRRANQLANYLRGLGMGPESLVGICVERSVEMVVGLLGILKAGSAYVPLDPEYPAERLAFMLADAKVAVLLTQERLRANLPPHGDARVVCLDADWSVVGRESDAPVGSGAGPDHLAYVIYTSGSTGKPKGAMNAHRGVCNRLLWMQDAYRLDAHDRVMQKTPFSFDVSVWEFFWPLMTGATMVIARPRGHQDSHYLAQLIDEQSVTTMHFVPPMLAVFLEEHGLAQKCRSLRQVVCSGEALPLELQQRFFEVFPDPGVKLHNLYGPTEAAVDVTFWECPRDSAETVVPIGRPIANTQIYLRDHHGQPVPVGVPGELHIGGTGVGRGYLGRLELTREKFIPDPFQTDPAARLYKTGDLARWREDGVIIYLGRLDHQVKVRGFRIELGEIEAAINGHPEVRESVVVVREDTPGERRLAAYVVTTDGSGTGLSNRLRDHLKSTLPEYMVPAAFVMLAALPLTPNGKVDRRALPAPDYSRAVDARTGTRAPATPLESYLVKLWGDILGIGQISTDANFFESGGDSLLGLRIVNRLREALGEHMSLVVMFEAPTILALSKLLTANYPAAVNRLCGPPAKSGEPATQPDRPLDEQDVSRMREIIGHAQPPVMLPRTAKNPPAVFILSPMRSGSTLLRIMLAGNPRLFSPPELQLLQFETLAERRAAFTGYERYMQEGTVRALMQMHGIDFAAAQAMMTERESNGCDVRRFYAEMQAAITPRLLVDKTPDYAMDLGVLRRAETFFDEARYIHLARHPLGMIRSYEEGHFLLESPYRGRHDFSARQMAELTWLISHRNIVDFLREIPSDRQRRVRFEDIVSSPEPEMRALGDFLGVGFDPGMTQPYQDGRARMTDGVHEQSVQVGDHNFHGHGALKPEVADKWKAAYKRDFLSPATWTMAASLEYANPFGDNAAMEVSSPPPAQASTVLPRITAASREARRVKRSTLTDPSSAP